MPHHAYFIAGETEQGIERALAFVESELGLPTQGTPNVITLRHGLLSVDDARKIRSLANLSATTGDKKALIISASRLFHEAQNALLKLFEEPPEGSYLFLVIPAEGMLLPTLRSRVLSLPTLVDASSATPSTLHSVGISRLAVEFIKGSKAEREKIISKLVDRAKSDKDEEKQAARLSAIQLAEGLTVSIHNEWSTEKNSSKKMSLQQTLNDLNRFIPILHERSAPLKLIFEHLLLTTA